MAPMATLARCFRRTIRTTGQPSARSRIFTPLSLDDVHAFFRRYYHPANASLALAGDIDTDEAVALARGYFESIPAGEPVAPVRADAALTGETRLLLEDRVELPRFYIAG